MKQETLEEFAKKESLKIYGNFTTEGIQSNVNGAIIKGAKWQQERSYNEEEVHRILGSYSAHQAVFGAEYTYDMWFEQFKKK